MEKDGECLDLALDMQDALDLNPFDGPPNMLMDDDLNMVTQEELEANLSAECPINEEITGGNKTNDMWEQLIQSVLEDSSTQEDILNKDDENDDNIGRDLQPTTTTKEHTETVDIKNEPDAVLEFSCEEEKMLVHDNDKCFYFEQDVCRVEEVYALSNHDNDENEFLNNDDILGSEEPICYGRLVWNNESDNLDNISQNEDRFAKRQNDYDDNEYKLSQLSNIMSDHCYISQERENSYYSGNDVAVLKRNLVNHLKTKLEGYKVQHELNEWVDALLHDMNEEKIVKVLQAFKEGEANEKIQNESGKELLGDTPLGRQQTQVIQKEIQATRFEDKEIIDTNILDISKESLLSEKKIEEDTIAINLSGIEVTVNTSLTQDICSEPLEHQMFDESFANENVAAAATHRPILNNMEMQSQRTVFSKLKQFAAMLQRDCSAMELDSSFNSDDRLHAYVRDQYQQFQSLFKQYCRPDVKDVELQVQIKPLARQKQKRQKLNVESKKKSFKISDYSSTSTTTDNSNNADDVNYVKNDDDDSKEQLVCPTANATALQKATLSTGSCIKALNVGSTTLSYDDGVSLTHYVQSEVFNLEPLSNNSSLSSDDSTTASIMSSSIKLQESTAMGKKLSEIDGKLDNYADDASNLFHEKKSTVSSVRHNEKHDSESDKENKGKRILDTDEEEEDRNDKEIERLINLDGLSKRSLHSSTTSKNSEKTKTKGSLSKSVNNAFDFTDVDFGSDESKCEAENGLVITEKQFLVRCNEDIKNQMLNESSSESENEGEGTNDDDELLHLPSEEGEDDAHSPLVEKFLKTFKVDDSDKELDDDNNDDDDDEVLADSDKEDPATDKAETMTKEVKADGEGIQVEQSEVSTEKKTSEEPSPTSSDIELLNDNLLFRKRSAKPKQLDKLLADAEKRKRISRIDEELISLSSESSDVEAVDEEARDKPRAIKPMLRPDQLAGETIKAQKSEIERIARLEKKHNMLNKVLKEHPEVDKDKDLILDYIKETKTFVKVHPDIVQFMKKHQCDGVRFMYDSCYGGADFLKKSSGSGCILAHCMGLGKTLQLIALLHTVISYKELKTTKILVLCPKSTVMNWADEILRWLGPLRQKNLKVYTFSDTSDINDKLNILREWSLSNSSRSGCLLIGYEAFRTLVFYHSYKKRGNIDPKRLEEIRKNVNNFLLEPGADLVVCDEGHIIKNSKSAISLSVAKIVTPRRIVLTGTPIQNNLKEYYSMVNFIKPLFLGTEKEFANLYANPIRNGQHKDSGKNDIKIMKQRSFVLHKKLSKFVQRKEAELLKTFLPQKFEYVLFIPMTEVQNNLYEFILKAIANREDNHRGRGLITDYTCLRKIWTHPKVLENAWKNAVNQKSKRDKDTLTKAKNQSDDDQPDDIYDSQTGQMSVINDWWRHLLTERDLESVMPSNKLRTMFNILQMCEEKGEKCLIFSAFVAVLNVVEYFFKKITEKDPQVLKELNINPNNKSQWVLGEDFYRLDGKTPKSLRHQMINVFNNVLNKRARVFLISAKAGGQGINLIGANRVIILDTSWNPSNDQQNIFRVFRLGQKRNCYIYRLLAMGTMEEKVYSRSVTKQAMSFRVVDIQQIDRHYSMAELAELYTLTKPDYTNRPTPILPQDSILARLLRSFPDLVYKYHEHDSLLENKIEQELSEQEKTEAWTAYERDLQMSSEVREMPNLEELQQTFLASKLQNYMSPFTGLDVSTTNSSNNNNNNNNKNMSTLFNYHSFGQPFLQSIMGQPNSTAAATQQYLDFYNYYKNLNSGYTDLTSYTNALNNANMLAGRFPPAGPAPSTSVSNPLSALGDLSMLGSAGLTSSAGLVGPTGLGVSKSLANNFPSILPQLPNTSLFGAAASNMPPTSTMPSAGGPAGSNLAANTTASLLSVYEQYAQSLRAPYNNMYSYASDFGLGSSGSTILDKTKMKSANKIANQSNASTASSNKASATVVSAKDIYAQPSPFSMPRSKPRSTNAGNNSSNNGGSANEATPLKGGQAANIANEPNSGKNSMMAARRNDSTNDLINYRRNEITKGAPLPPARSVPENLTTKNNNNHGNSNVTALALTQRKTENRDKPSGSNLATATAAASSSLSSKPNSTSTPTHIAVTAQSSATIGAGQHNPIRTMKTALNQKVAGQKNKYSMPTTTTISKNLKLTSSTGNNLDTNRSVNMGILYPNSSTKSSTSTSVTNSNPSPVNMGIIYPQSKATGVGGKTSEMQIIPTSSPPGTSSISKQLNDISPSISLTALKSTTATNTTATTKPLTYSTPTNHTNKLAAGVASKNPNINNSANRKNITTTATTTTTSSAAVPAASSNNLGGNQNHNKSSSLAFNLSSEQNHQFGKMKMSQNLNKKSSNDNTNTTNFLTNPMKANLSSNANSSTTLSNSMNNTLKKLLPTQTLNRGGLTITTTKATPTTMSINPTKTTTNTNSIALAKLTAAAVLAKSNNANNNSNNNNQRVQPTVSNVQKSIVTTTNTPAATLSPLTYTTIKRAIVKKDAAQKVAAIPQQITLTSNNNSISIKPTTITATINNNNNNNNKNNNNNSLNKTIIKTNPSLNTHTQRNSPIPKLTPIPAIANANKTVIQNRLPITITSAHTASTATTAAASSSANTVNIGRNTVNIRPVDGKQNTSGTNNVYIIETNINDKKVAIGTPTRGGGGTTVTKVPLHGKRKANDSLSKEIRIETKRFKE